MKSKIISYTYVIIILLVLSSYSSIQVAADTVEANKITDPKDLLNAVPLFDRKIAIAYSSKDVQAKDMATGINQFLSPFYQPVDMFEINKISDLLNIDSTYWIVIHVYDTTVEGPIIGGNSYLWSDLAEYISDNSDKHHVLSMANTKQATVGLGASIQFASLVDDQTEMTDAKLAVVNAIWLVGNYIADNAPTDEYTTSADYIRALVVKYFSENINDLVQRSYQPENPIGQINTSAQQERFDNLMEASPKTANYMTPDGVSIPLYEAVTQSLINKDEYGMVLNNADNDFTIASIPTKTGIEGPAGKVLDTLLGILLKYVQYVELSPSVVNQINEIMKYIPKVLGIIKDPSVSNILDLALDIIVERFPGFKEYRKYVEIALEGFNALRGGPEEIIAFSLKMIKEFFPAGSTVVTIAETILNDELAVLIRKISAGDNIFQAILSWISNLVLDNFLDQIFKSWLKFDIKDVLSNAGQVSTLSNSISISATTSSTDQTFLGRTKSVLGSVFKSVLGIFQTQDSSEYIDKVLPQLIFAELIPNLYPLIGRTIVVDPGHGGNFTGSTFEYDNGTVLKEKDWNLAVSLELKDALLNLGANVVMTRQSDTQLNNTIGPDLRTRAKIANDTNMDGVKDYADAFISVHFNAFKYSNGTPVVGARGHETFYHTSNQYGGELATEIYSNMINDLGMYPRGVKTENFAVIRGTPTIPQALVEVGFITNPADRTKFEYRANRTQAGLSIANGIAEYFAQGNGPQLPVPKVVMIPGWRSDPTVFNTMIGILESQGIDVVDFDDNLPGTQALSYDATLGAGNLDTAQLANQVEDLINARVASDEKVNIIAYSYGGLISRYLIEAGPSDPNIDDTWAARVDRLFMHGTPNHGTWEAYLGSVNLFYQDWAASADDMKPNSPLLTALGYNVPPGEKYITFGGNPSYLNRFDGVVPTDSPFLINATNYEIEGSHQELVTLPSAIDIVFKELGYQVLGQGQSLFLKGENVTVQLEYFDIISDNAIGTEDYFFDVYVDKDGLNNNFELITTFSYSQDGPFTWNPGGNGPISPTFSIPGTSAIFDVRVVVREKQITINTFDFRNIMFSKDIDGMGYYNNSAPDPSVAGSNEMRISVSGFTSNPDKINKVSKFSSMSMSGYNIMAIAPVDTKTFIQKYLDAFKPLIEIGKLAYWIAGKLGGIKDAKSFLENFPISTAVDKLFNAVYTATGLTYPNLQSKIKEYAELAKAVLNGTINSLTIANSIIDSVVSGLSSIDIDIKAFIGNILKFVIAKIADINSPLRSLTSSNLESLIKDGLALFLKNVNENVRDSIETILTFILPGVLNIMAVLKESPSLASIVASSPSLTPQQALEEARTKSGEFLRDLTKELFSRIPTSLLSETQNKRLSMIVGEIPFFILSLVSSSFDTETSISGILRSLGLFTINLVMEKIQTTLAEKGINDFAVIYFIQLAETMFKGLVDDKFKVEMPSLEKIMKDLTPYLIDTLQGILSPEAYDTVKFFIDIIPSVIEFFQDGIGWLINELKRWLSTILSDIIDKLLEQLNDLFSQYKFFSIAGEMPIGFGPFSLFEFSYNFEITANLEFDRVGLRDFIISILFDGSDVLNGLDLGGMLSKVLSFLKIAPVVSGNFGIKQLSTSEGGIFKTLLELLGVNIEFSGYAYFSIMLFQLGANGFDSQSFLKVIAWGLQISILIYKDITIFDLFTGGLGGGFLNRLAKYIGLDLLVLRIQFGIDLVILMRADTPTTSASGIAILRFMIEAGLRLSIGVNLFIAGAKLTFYAGIRLVLSFDQDFLRRSQPLRIIFRILIILEASVTIKFLFKKKTWRWRKVLEPFGPFDLSPKKRDDVISNGGMGYDNDYDGIPDEYERRFPGLNIGGIGGSTLNVKDTKVNAMNIKDLQTLQRSSSDTDGDGLSDKEELKFYLTDPTIPDSDGDGLIDSVEINLHTNPLRKDSDYDGLTDYEEVVVYGTDPLNSDTDQDGLSDKFEITHEWNMTGITASVKSVIIGGKEYFNRTDPLNPDTDNDLLLDGQEGKNGAYYGGDKPYVPSAEVDDQIWNQGYTHPLDNDTDDDSYMQAYTGEILPSRTYLGDMRDGIEVRGITATIIENGDYITRIFYTDPTRSDSDGDTGPGGIGVVMVSDGYELYYQYDAQQPTDPLSGDSDNDGLLDTFEIGNNTNPLDSDTDLDGLNDRLEVLIGSNPNSSDTDGDGLSDAQEYFELGTNPLSTDTDFDGLSDGDEVNVYGSSPHLQDTDSDGFYDGEEVEIGISPTSTDADDDGISDRNEIFIYKTDPNLKDTDGDGLSDYDEIFTYKTSPLNRDTDQDSIINPDGSILFDLNDYEEVININTNPSSPDTDGDGLSDGEEVYLASGLATVTYKLDPTNSDTDGDGLEDGEELQIIIEDDGSKLIIETNEQYNSSAVLSDTDFDGVDDRTEVLNGSKANNPDSDNDQIPDYDEYYRYLDVSPIDPDTDGDSIIDSLELLKVSESEYVHHPNVDFNKIRDSGIMIITIDPNILPKDIEIQNITIKYYNTYSWDADTDDDLLPDGAELFIYQPNFPAYSPEVGKQDTNNNGILDGLDLDLDGDGLEDGYEYSGANPTVDLNDWAVFDPDVDRDTITDGDEVYIYNTRPDRADSDNDTFSDGFEIIVSSDPNVFTTDSEMTNILSAYQGPIMIISPFANTEYDGSTGEIPVIVFNITNVERAWYRYKSLGENFGSNKSLSYYSETNPGLWYDLDSKFDNGTYILESFISTSSGEIYMDVIIFSINETISSVLLNQFKLISAILVGSGILGVIAVPSVRKKIFKGRS